MIPSLLNREHVFQITEMIYVIVVFLNFGLGMVMNVGPKNQLK